MTEIKYTSFAIPPYGIKVDKIYFFDKDSKGYFYSDARIKEHLPVDEIKMLFTPVGKTWSEVLNAKTRKKDD